MGSGQGKSSIDLDTVLPDQTAVPSSSKKSFGDNYELGESLGTGSFGEVNRATVKQTVRAGGKKQHCDVEVAVKVVRKEYDAYTEAVRQLSAEYEILKAVKHPHIIYPVELFPPNKNGDMFLVLELCKGGELVDMLAVRDPAFPEHVAAHICRNILSAVEFLHKNSIVHHDLKLENLLLRRKNDLKSVVIADFGLACKLQEDDGRSPESDQEQQKPRLVRRPSNLFCGSSGPYLAPEVKSLIGEELHQHVFGKLQKAVDMWCIGVITHLLLCGREPDFTNSLSDDDDIFGNGYDGLEDSSIYHFDDVRHEHKKLGLSDEAQQFISAMLEVDPAVRGTATEMLNHKWIKTHVNEQT